MNGVEYRPTSIEHRLERDHPGPYQWHLRLQGPDTSVIREWFPPRYGHVRYQWNGRIHIGTVRVASRTDMAGVITLELEGASPLVVTG